jgi:segregation and condensation protein A
MPGNSEAPQAALPLEAIDAGGLVLHLDGFDGPLDLLLDLARGQKENGQKVDLARISILSLVEQYLAVIEGARGIRLELAADWLVMAAWLTWLKSRLLLPPGTEAAEEGELAAEVLAGRLRDLAAVRRVAAWLGERAQLGQDVFARGGPEDFAEIDRSRLALELPALVRAYLGAIRRGRSGAVYRPAGMTLWSVKDALARLAKLVGGLPDWTTLEAFLPETLHDGREWRVAVASTLIAGLEMARDGALRLRQETAFGPILVRGAPGPVASVPAPASLGP